MEKKSDGRGAYERECGWLWKVEQEKGERINAIMGLDSDTSWEIYTFH